MKKRFKLATIGGVDVTATRAALTSSLLLWTILAVAGAVFFDLTPAVAVAGGLLATLLHWASELAHQFGHAAVAHRVGYPMREIRLLFVLATSRYPRDEPTLPAEIHIRRALGGAPVSFLLALLGLLPVLLLHAGGGLPYLLALFFSLENLLVFGFGAFLPLGFTDGSTLLTWWPRRGNNP